MIEISILIIPFMVIALFLFAYLAHRYATQPRVPIEQEQLPAYDIKESLSCTIVDIPSFPPPVYSQ